jgi:hypothetical protein
MAQEGMALFFQDLRSHRAVNVERLVASKDDEHSKELRGAIKAIDFILTLPESVENWKKQ